MNRYAALVVAASIGVGCSDAPAEKAGTTTASTTKPSKAMRFSACMREHGVSGFPDPDARGELTIDAVVNGSSLDTGSPAWEEAISACRDLQPAGFTGERRDPRQQQGALAFAQCMRDNGIEDFPDPKEGEPLIDTSKIPSAEGRGALSIPGFQEATEACRRQAGEAGVRP